MKSKAIEKTTRTSAFEIAYLVLPILALTPNFFIVPDLSFQGLATQEAVFGVVITIFALAGAVYLVRSNSSSSRMDRNLSPPLIALAAFIGWQLASLAWAPAPYDGARVSGIWLGFGVLFTIGALWLRPQSAIRLHAVLTLVAALLAISVIYERWVYGEYLKGIFFSHGISAEILATLLPLQILNYLCTERRWSAIVSLLISSLSVVALLIGLRRGALLGTLLAFGALGVSLAMKKIPIKSRSRLLIIVILFLTTSTVLGVVFHERILFRIEGATQLDAAEGGLRTRVRGWLTAWEMGKRNLIVGVGNGGYPNLYGEYRKYFASDPKYTEIASTAGGEDFDEIRTPLAHNEYLEVFVELGIVGLALMLVFATLLIRPLWRARENPWVLGVLLGLLAFGISSFFSAFSFRYTPAAFIVACLLSIGYAFSRRTEISSTETDVKAIEAGADSRLPKWVALASCVVVIAGCAIFAVRCYRVYESQWLQGRAGPRTPPLDFVFFPGNPAGNEALERRYQHVLSLDPENAGARLGVGLLLFQMKKPAEAIPSIEYALNHGYSRPFGYALLAFAREQNGELDRAAKTMADCVASFPQSIFARAVYGEMLRKAGRIEEFRSNQSTMYQVNKPQATSWELALKMGAEEAMTEAKRQGLISPDRLEPRFAASLVGVRAFHYLKKVEN